MELTPGIVMDKVESILDTMFKTDCERSYKMRLNHGVYPALLVKIKGRSFSGQHQLVFEFGQCAPDKVFAGRRGSSSSELLAFEELQDWILYTTRWRVFDVQEMVSKFVTNRWGAFISHKTIREPNKLDRLDSYLCIEYKNQKGWVKKIDVRVAFEEEHGHLISLSTENTFVYKSAIFDFPINLEKILRMEFDHVAEAAARAKDQEMHDIVYGHKY